MNVSRKFMSTYVLMLVNIEFTNLLCSCVCYCSRSSYVVTSYYMSVSGTQNSDLRLDNTANRSTSARILLAAAAACSFA